jgi:hypothetical protein
MVVVLPVPFVDAVDRRGFGARALARAAGTGRSTTASLLAHARTVSAGEPAEPRAGRIHYTAAAAIATALDEPVGRLFVADPNPLAD